jgi:SAM-dependent methyltransferase
MPLMPETLITSLPPLPKAVRAGKVPMWAMDQLVHRACPICEMDIFTPIVRRPDNLLVVRCQGCAMLFLADIPVQEEIEAFYRKYSEFKEYNLRHHSWLRNILRSMTDPYVQLLEQTGGLKGKSVLDIGCSYGQFIQLAEVRGAVISGVELDEGASKYLTGRGVRVTRRISSTDKYDVITCFQLMEHLANPADLVREISAVLVEDGRFLLAFPNAEEANRCGPGWIGFRVDLEHLNYFTLRSVSQLLARTGLYVEQVWTYGQPGIERKVIKQGIAHYILKKMQSLNRAMCPADINYMIGNYVMAVLARKV